MTFVKTVLWWLLAALLIGAVLARGAVRIDVMVPVTVGLYAMILIWLMAVAGRGSSQGRFARFDESPVSGRRMADGAIILLFVLAALSSFTSVYLWASHQALLRFAALIGVYYVVRYAFDGLMTKRLIYLVIGLGATLSGYGILQYLGLCDRSWWVPQEFLSATFVNHNHYAGLLELIIPVAMAALITARAQPAEKDARRFPTRIILAAALVVMGAAFILTQSRAGWASLAIALTVMAVSFMGRRKGYAPAVFIILLVVSIAGVFIFFVQDVVGQRLALLATQGGGELPFEGRLAMWRGAAALIAERPLIGTGIGTFVYAFPRYRPAPLQMQANFAHNDYLEYAAEMGIPALCLMVVLIGAVIRSGYRTKRAPLYGIGPATGILSIALHGLFDFNFHILSNMLLFIVWCGILTGMTAPHRHQTGRS